MNHLSMTVNHLDLMQSASITIVDERVMEYRKEAIRKELEAVLLYGDGKPTARIREKNPGFRNVDTEEMIEFKNQGKSSFWIGRHYNIAASSVRTRINRYLARKSV